MIAALVLLLFLAVAVGAFFTFERFGTEVHASNRRVPAATKRALAPAGDVLSQPQVLLIVFDRASLLTRVDPGRRVISLLSIPSSAYLRWRGGPTVGEALRAGTAGFVRFVRGGLHLEVEHVALLRAHDIGPLVDAIGGIAVEDVTSFGTRTQLLDGDAAARYISEAPPSSVRRQRERAMLEGVISRLAGVASLSRLPHLARTFSASVATDLSPRDTLALALVRLRTRFSVQCGLPEQAALGRPASKRVLRQFEGLTTAPHARARTFPSSGCGATPLAARAPAAIIYLGEKAVALFPFVPELALIGIALDLILLSALLGIPQALLGVVRRGRAPRGVDDDLSSEPALDESLQLQLPRATAPVDDVTAPPERPTPSGTEAAQASFRAEGSSQRRVEESLAAVMLDVAEDAAPRTAAESASSPSGTPETAPPTIRRLAALKADLLFRLDRLRQHTDVAWLVVGTAAAVLCGYLISRL